MLSYSLLFAPVLSHVNKQFPDSNLPTCRGRGEAKTTLAKISETARLLDLLPFKI
jgi:hypothetical protein